MFRKLAVFIGMWGMVLGVAISAPLACEAGQTLSKTLEDGVTL